MVNGSGSDQGRGRRWRIGRLVCAVTAVMALLAGVAVVASAQISTNPPPVANPSLREACGLKVALVLDESASIPSPGGNLPSQVPTVRGAAKGFVDALEGTGSHLAIMAFSRTARAGYPTSGYQEVTPSTANGFHGWINGPNPPTGQPANPNGYNPQNTAPYQGTNWQDGLLQVTRTAGGPPDLVVFLTDGLPNYYNGTGGPTLVSPDGNITVMNAATAAANTVKQTGAGSRIFAIGVGSATEDAASRERLKNISGPTRYPVVPGEASTNDFKQGDFSTVGFDELKTEMTGIVAALCGSRLIVTKHILDHNGAPVQDAPGWNFSATLNPTPGHTWLSPSSAGDHHTASLETGHDGIADFQWRLHEPGTATVSVVHEHERDGFTFVSAQCVVHRSDGDEEHLPIDTEQIPGSELARTDFQTCDVVNRQRAATLTVVKRVLPSADPGRFDLLVNHQVRREHVGDGGSIGPITLPLGDHTVSETGAEGTALGDYDSSIRCVDVADNDRLVSHGEGTSLHVSLTSEGENVVCTITNVNRHFGQLTVIKHLIPRDDSGRFNLLVNGDVHAHAVADGGSTGPIRVAFGTHEVTEEPAAGTSLSHYEISTTCIDEHTGAQVAHNAHGPAVAVHLSRGSDDIQCTISNARPGVKVARLTVVKHLVPHDDAGRFDLLVGGRTFAVGVGHNGSTGPLEFELGRHVVTEHAVGRTNLADFSVSTRCVDMAHGGHTIAHNAHGPSVSVDLSRASDDIVCTITNRRAAAPPAGGGQAPRPPAAAPQLSLTKTMPSHAQVRQLVPVTITVHNLGSVTAHGVQLHETPPVGMRVLHAAQHGAVQPNGTVVWHLGSLAHGVSRTVHATLRVVHVGLHVNAAVATALNADPALSIAAVRARAPAHHRHPKPPPPRVTG